MIIGKNKVLIFGFNSGCDNCLAKLNAEIDKQIRPFGDALIAFSEQHKVWSIDAKAVNIFTDIFKLTGVASPRGFSLIWMVNQAMCFNMMYKKMDFIPSPFRDGSREALSLKDIERFKHEHIRQWSALEMLSAI